MLMSMFFVIIAVILVIIFTISAPMLFAESHPGLGCFALLISLGCVIFIVLFGSELNNEKWYRLVPDRDYKIAIGTVQSDRGIMLSVLVQDPVKKYKYEAFTDVNNIRDIESLQGIALDSSFVYLNHQEYNSGSENNDIWIHVYKNKTNYWYKLNEKEKK